MEPDIGTEKDSNISGSIKDRSDSWLLREWKSGDEQAAEVLLDRYSIRLVALVASRLNHRFQASIDPSEVVQSAMGSFFDAARHSRIQVSQSVSLWRLLATFARRKLARSIERQSAIKRGGDQLQLSLDRVKHKIASIHSMDGEDEADAFLKTLKTELPDDLFVIAEGVLAGQTQRDLAELLAIDERTVRRRLSRIRKLLAPNSARKDVNTHPAISVPKLPKVNYNEFVLGKLIGSGGFGKVYRATMQSGGQTVAVKFLRRVYWQTEDARQSFLREINLASQINDPGVINYLGYGESPHGGPYLLSEWINGQTLRDMAHPSTEQFISWLVQICRAIEAVHQAGLIHGDLTPGNILIDMHGRIKITDFGFSQATASAATRISGGTLGFAAPEQIDPCFGNTGPGTDIYAIGGLIFWYLYGTPPNTGDDLGNAVAVTIKAKELQFTDCQQPFRSILKATLCPAPADRIQSAGELISLLE